MAIQKRKWKDSYTYRVRIFHLGSCVNSATFDTKAAAERWEREQKRRLDKGQLISPEAEKTTLAEAIDRYAKDVSPYKRGHRQELGRLRFLKTHRIAQKPLSGIRGADVALLRDELSQSRKPATVKLYLALLSHLFNTARKEWAMESLANPVELVKKPTVRNARDRRLEPGEEERLLNALKHSGNKWIKSLSILAIETAMRKGELLGLRWEHIDIQKRTAFLPLTKNGESRTVPLSSRAIKTLLSLPRPITGEVFITSEHATRKAFRKACAQAGIEGLRFHDLRHEATSRLAETFAVHELAKITGHKDMKMLLRYYHPRAEDLARKLM